MKRVLILSIAFLYSMLVTAQNIEAVRFLRNSRHLFRYSFGLMPFSLLKNLLNEGVSALHTLGCLTVFDGAVLSVLQVKQPRCHEG